MLIRLTNRSHSASEVRDERRDAALLARLQSRFEAVASNTPGYDEYKQRKAEESKADDKVVSINSSINQNP
ncbi:hypothetical protein AAFX24_27970 [Vibrio mediterranei]|uniref:hypothetical protein n=1 Tax=Vibrio mediterranei TaxID=689 RepID=UPI0038CF22DA